jgi:FkbM family methyltransferase
MNELTKEVMERHGLDPEVIFDVGAYDCYHTQEMKGWFPRSTVVAFEASVRNYAEKCLYRAWTGITLIHAAVLNYDGVAFFYDSQGEYQGSGSALPPNLEQLRQYYPTMEFMPPYRVPAIRIDTFCRVTGCKPPDFLHIDAQGADRGMVGSTGVVRDHGERDRELERHRIRHRGNDSGRLRQRKRADHDVAGVVDHELASGGLLVDEIERGLHAGLLDVDRIRDSHDRLPSLVMD